MSNVVVVVIIIIIITVKSFKKKNVCLECIMSLEGCPVNDRMLVR